MNEYLCLKFVKNNRRFLFKSYSWSGIAILVYICNPCPEADSVTPKNQLHLYNELNIWALSCWAISAFLISISITWKPFHNSNAFLPIGRIPLLVLYNTLRLDFAIFLFDGEFSRSTKSINVQAEPSLAVMESHIVIEHSFSRFENWFCSYSSHSNLSGEENSSSA